MDLEEFVTRFPVAYHVTEAGAWPFIQRHGLLSTSALLDLFEIDARTREQIETRPRPASVTIDHPDHGTAVIRDNKPLRPHILERCLDGCGVTDWCRVLNSRVFFWATEQRLENHLRARGHRHQARELVTIDTRSLMERHGASVTLCAFNSGSALYPNAPRRGPDTFTTVEHYPYDEMRRRHGARNALAEICVQWGLPDITAVASSIHAITEDGARHLIGP
ncbi:hypothetical protein GCM10029978_095230 [Actinoallomurus acanthiterrae]